MTGTPLRGARKLGTGLRMDERHEYEANALPEGCFGDAALEDYVFGRRKEGPMGAHLAACASCAARTEALREEAGLFASLLRCGHGAPATPCPDALELGRYLDGGGTKVERENLEAHLTSCPSCLHQVVHIYKEVRICEYPMDTGPVAGASIAGVPVVAENLAGETVAFEALSADSAAAETSQRRRVHGDADEE